MQLHDLLEQVRQRRETDRLEKEFIVEQQRAIETEKVQGLLRAFKEVLQKHFGYVLDALDADKSFQYHNRDLVCSFAVKHTIISIKMSEHDVEGCFSKAKTLQSVVGYTYDPSVGISVDVAEGYFSNLKTLQPATGCAWFKSPQKALDFLLDLIFDICEEYDRLLPEFQAASAKLAQEETTQRLLAEYRRAIEEAVEKSDREIADLNTVLKCWQWPEEGLRQLKLHKITWHKHAFLDLQGKAHFDYEYGWSLSDLPRSSKGYYDLLPEHNKSARDVKPGYPVTVERYYFTADDAPEELLEKATQQLEIVKVYDCILEQSSRVLPQFLPELPPEIADNFAIEPAIVTLNLDIPPQPCFEIRQALSLNIADADNGSNPF